MTLYGYKCQLYVYPALDNDVVLAGHQLVSGTLYPDVNILHIDWGIESQYVMITIGSHCKGMLGIDCLSRRRGLSAVDHHPIGINLHTFLFRKCCCSSDSDDAMLCRHTCVRHTPYIGLGREAGLVRTPTVNVHRYRYTNAAARHWHSQFHWNESSHAR